MSLRIRMSRGGTKKRPYYRVVIADSRSPRDGRFIERIGSYDPMLARDNPERVKIDAERARRSRRAVMTSPQAMKSERTPLASAYREAIVVFEESAVCRDNASASG